MVRLYMIREKELSFFKAQTLRRLENEHHLLCVKEGEEEKAVKKVIFFTASWQLVKYSGAYIMDPEENIDDVETVVLNIQGKNQNVGFCVPIKQNESVYLTRDIA